MALIAFANEEIKHRKHNQCIANQPVAGFVVKVLTEPAKKRTNVCPCQEGVLIKTAAVTTACS